MEKYVVLEKKVGETPLACAETYRGSHPELAGVAMAYAGRLDPMASGKLLILLGEECKQQEQYHGLDKEYEFAILLGIESDTHDVLGRLHTCENTPPQTEASKIEKLCTEITGPISLPYPHFSSKTVHGKPLHTWTLENRLDEIAIPENESMIYELTFIGNETLSRTQICDQARTKIDTIPPVTDLRKAIGNDFRRVDVRKDWENIRSGTTLPNTYQIAHFRCTASSGTYMRSLAHMIGHRLGTCGLAWHIHRTKIGQFDPAKHTWIHTF